MRFEPRCWRPWAWWGCLGSHTFAMLHTASGTVNGGLRWWFLFLYRGTGEFAAECEAVGSISKSLLENSWLLALGWEKEKEKDLSCTTKLDILVCQHFDPPPVAMRWVVTERTSLLIQTAKMRFLRIVAGRILKRAERRATAPWQWLFTDVLGMSILAKAQDRPRRNRWRNYKSHMA